MLKDLEQFVNIDSPSGYETGMLEFQGLVIERMKAMGANITTKKVVSPMAGYNVKAVWQGKGKGRFLLLAHADTVWPVGTVAARPFKIIGDKAYGPGVCDCKAGIVQILHVVEILQNLSFEEFESITFIMNPDEEKGSRQSRDFIRECARKQDVVFCCEAGKEPDIITVWRKGSGQLTVEVTGKSSHAGNSPEKGVNAVLELCHQISAISLLGDNEKGTTIQFTQIEGSKNPHNVIPAYAKAVSSVRVMSNDEFDRIESDAESVAAKPSVAGAMVNVLLHRNRPPMEVSAQGMKLVQLMQDIYCEDLQMELATGGSGGASDANLVADLCVVVDSVGIVGGNAHHEEEYLEIKSIVPRTYLLCKCIMEYGACQLQ